MKRYCEVKAAQTRRQWFSTEVLPGPIHSWLYWHCPGYAVHWFGVVGIRFL